MENRGQEPPGLEQTSSKVGADSSANEQREVLSDLDRPNRLYPSRLRLPRPDVEKQEGKKSSSSS